MTEDKVASALGSISAQITSLSDRMDRDREDMILHREEERVYRDKIAGKIQNLENNQLILIKDSKSLEARVEKTEGVSKLVYSVRNQAIGGFMVISIFGSLLWIALSETLKESVKKIFGWISSGAG